jgi:hypothetical protein
MQQLEQGYGIWLEAGQALWLGMKIFDEEALAAGSTQVLGQALTGSAPGFNKASKRSLSLFRWKHLY